MSHPLFSPARIERKPADWLILLTKLKNELAFFLQMEIEIVGAFIPQQDSTHASYGVALDIVIIKNLEKKEKYGGVLCLSINYDEGVWIDAFCLEFRDKKRASEHLSEVYTINYSEKEGWNNPQWMIDEFGEWENYTDMKRWEGNKGNS